MEFRLPTLQAWTLSQLTTREVPKWLLTCKSHYHIDDSGMYLPNNMVTDRCELPEDFCIDGYAIFQGNPSRVLVDGDTIDLGGRTIQVLHTPGHSPGHLCFWEDEKGYLYSGDLVYEGTLFANYPSTDPQSYLTSLEKIALLPVKQIFPGHHSLNICPELVIQMRDAFCGLNEDSKLCHGSGTCNYGDWAIAL